MKSYITANNIKYSYQETEISDGFTLDAQYEGTGTLKQQSTNLATEYALKIKPFKKFGLSFITGFGPYFRLNNNVSWSTPVLKKYSTYNFEETIFELDPILNYNVGLLQTAKLNSYLFVAINYQHKKNNFQIKTGFINYEFVNYRYVVFDILGFSYYRQIW